MDDLSRLTELLDRIDACVAITVGPGGRSDELYVRTARSVRDLTWEARALVDRMAAPPFGPDAACEPTGGNLTPLANIAARAVDLGDPTLSETFRSIAAPPDVRDFESRASTTPETPK